VREFLLRVKYLSEKDRVEFPIASDLIAEIEALIDMLKKEEKEKEKKREGEKKEGNVGKKKKEEITVGAGGSSIGSGSSSTAGSSDVSSKGSDKEEGSEGSSESKNEGSSGVDTSSSSGSGTGTTVGETDIPLPYLSTFETYTDIPWTENDINEIARAILNYAQLRGRRCKVKMR
jgi:hypothetical protein